MRYLMTPRPNQPVRADGSRGSARLGSNRHPGGHAVAADLEAVARAGQRGGIHLVVVGQISASVLFFLYSIALHSWVFVVTNGLVLGTAVAGQVMARVKRNRDAS